MKRLTSPVSLALIALGILDLTRPGVAQQPPQELVPFKAAVKGPVPSFFVIPGHPMTASVQQSSTGQSDLLGSFTWVEHHIPRFGVDDMIKAVTGTSVFTASNGDALYLATIGLARPTATPGGGMSENAFFVTGGSGRFAGATGSGVMIGVLDPVKKEVTFSYDGMIALPKK